MHYAFRPTIACLNVFTRDSIYAIARIGYRPSVRPSSFSIFLRGKFHPEILRGSPRSGASNKGGVGKISSFLSLSVNISKTVADTAKVTIND